MQETLHDHRTLISIGGRPRCNLQFADNIDFMGGSSSELQDFTDRLTEQGHIYGMDVSTKMSKIMTNGTNKHERPETRGGDQCQWIMCTNLFGMISKILFGIIYKT